MVIIHEMFCRGLVIDLFSSYGSAFVVNTYDVLNSNVASKNLLKHIKR